MFSPRNRQWFRGLIACRLTVFLCDMETINLSEIHGYLHFVPMLFETSNKKLDKMKCHMYIMEKKTDT